MTGFPSNYDAWRTAGPDEDRVEVGTEEGQPCNRTAEPDKDAPRGCKPRRCTGAMVLQDVECCSCHINAPCHGHENQKLECDTCGEEA